MKGPPNETARIPRGSRHDLLADFPKLPLSSGFASPPVSIHHMAGLICPASARILERPQKRYSHPDNLFTFSWNYARVYIQWGIPSHGRSWIRQFHIHPSIDISVGLEAAHGSTAC